LNIIVGNISIMTVITVIFITILHFIISIMIVMAMAMYWFLNWTLLLLWK